MQRRECCLIRSMNMTYECNNIRSSQFSLIKIVLPWENIKNSEDTYGFYYNEI